MSAVRFVKPQVSCIEYPGRYLLDDDYERISAALQQQLLVEEETLRSMRKSRYQMEEEMLRRLWNMGRSGA